MEIVFIIVGIAVGAAVGILITKSQRTKAEAQCEMLQTEVERLKTDDENQKKTIIELQSRNQELSNAKTKAETQLENQKELQANALKSMEASFRNTINDLNEKMKATTEEMLKERQRDFATSSKTSIQSIIEPLNATIGKMKEELKQYKEAQDEFSGSMKTNIETIITQTETTRQSAEELTTALKHDSKMQGDYGEVILDEILKKQGFTEGVHYELQYVMKDELGRELKGDDGKGLRPDVIFHLDTVRDVIIDSKINLTDFINFANAKTLEERKEYLDRHVKSIERQVALLSQKNYTKYHKKTKGRMDYVIMFVPISAAWWEALRYQPDLWRRAMEKKVYIADEQTLFAALSIIRLTWTQIAQLNSQKEIFDNVNTLIDRIGKFLKQFMQIDKAIKDAQEAYDRGYKLLTPGGQSIITTADKLVKLGGRVDKKNPLTEFLDVDDIQQLPSPESLKEEEEEGTDE